jgi:hypothetical protein
VDDAAVTLVILGVVIVLFIWNRVPVGVIALLTLLTLWATGLLSVTEALAGFGDPVVIFIATLFVVSEGIDSRGSPPGSASSSWPRRGRTGRGSSSPSACCVPCSRR